jgi:long-subunit acyl-CoA synthetase (AMP-forming)
MPGSEIAGPPLPEVPFSSVPEMVAARAAVDPARVAIRSRSPAGRWVDLSWGTLDACRRAVAGGFAALGVKRGDVVAPIFPGYSPEFLHHCVADTAARLAVVGTAGQQHQLSRERRLKEIFRRGDPFGNA